MEPRFRHAARLGRVLAGLALLWAGMGPALADSADAKPSPRGYGSPGYSWARMTAEQVAVLKLQGDAQRGAQVYRQCAGCHRADGAGLADGTYPRLSGQHAGVIIKQVTDTRAGIRINPKMAPFSSEHALELQDIADVAEFLSSAVSHRENGKGEAEGAERGSKLYRQRGCHDCHGARGEGDHAKFYPVVAAQHFHYLLREMEHVQTGGRGNSHPDMVKTLRGLPPEDLRALASHLSRLPDHRSPR
jgi:cytochrome c553